MSESAIYYLPAVEAEPAAAVARKPSTLSDVLLFHADDGGEIEIIGGAVTLSDGYASAAYLSLFGGNEDDSGQPADLRKQWWGNLLQADPARQYRSETQYLLNALPPTSGNLRRIEAAAKKDLAWFVSKRIAREVRVTATMPKLNAINVDVLIVLAVTGEAIPLPRFARGWGRAAA